MRRWRYYTLFQVCCRRISSWYIRFFPGGSQMDFFRWESKVAKFYFTLSKLRKRPFLAKNLIGNVKFQIPGPCPLLPKPMDLCIAGVGTGIGLGWRSQMFSTKKMCFWISSVVRQQRIFAWQVFLLSSILKFASFEPLIGFLAFMVGKLFIWNI